MAEEDKGSGGGAIALIAGGVVLVGGVAAYLLSRGEPVGTVAPVPATPAPVLPKPGIPIYTPVKISVQSQGMLGAPADGAIVDDTLRPGGVYKKGPAPNFLQVFTTFWDPSANMWGAWSPPAAFRGHLVEQKTWFTDEEWNSPDADLITYLQGLALTNPNGLGFWIARRFPVAAEDPKTHEVQRTGPPGPWMSGRVGDLRGLNPDMDVITRNILELVGGHAENANVTIFALLKRTPLPVPAEIKLA